MEAKDLINKGYPVGDWKKEVVSMYDDLQVNTIRKIYDAYSISNMLGFAIKLDPDTDIVEFIPYELGARIAKGQWQDLPMLVKEK